MIAFDTSALVKLVVEEDHSEALESWLIARPDSARVASALCRVELLRAIARLTTDVEPVARDLLAGLDLVPLTPTILERAATLPPPALRSLDAIHLATAGLLGGELEAFVVYDERLADAARAAGLPVAQPT